MWKKLALLSLSLWVLSVAFIGYRFVFGNAHEVDKRMQISLAPEERELVLGEMRLLLKGVKGIINGLSQDDFKVVEASASGVGMAMAQDVNPALMAKLPMTFKKMGMGVHQSFDDLAVKVPSLNQKQILTEVDRIMTTCVACHGTFKIVESK